MANEFSEHNRPVDRFSTPSWFQWRNTIKRIESQTNINQLLHDLPESTQQVIWGGTSNEASEDSEAMSVIRPKRFKESIEPTG